MQLKGLEQVCFKLCAMVSGIDSFHSENCIDNKLGFDLVFILAEEKKEAVPATLQTLQHRSCPSC